MIVCFLLQAIFVHQSFSYTKSVVGHPGTDTVQTQEFDSYEILEEVSKPSNIKSVSELHALHPDRYPEIAESDYGWQGHNLNEMQMLSYFQCKKRYKVRYIFNPNYAEQHTTALYVPPGELITIELPEKHANGVSITVNNHAENVDDVTRTPRYPILGCTTKISITGRVTKFGWPLGGNLVFSFGIDKYTNNFEVNISGVILSPYFRYGSTTDEEWEDTIRQYPGPYTFLDTGAVHIQLPSSTIRSATQLNDAMAFLRGVSVITYSGGEIAYNDRRSDGRVQNPNYWYLDSYVRVGEAYAVQGANIVRAPNYWSGSIVNYNSQRQGCWGTIHEYGHHFQDWGFERYGEASNNIYAIITYSLYTPISSTRTPNGDGTMSATSNDGWSYVTHQNGILNYEGGNVVLTLYANLMYAFGQEKTLEIIHADRYNTYYYHSDGDSTTLTRPARYFMTACKVLQRNLIPYFNSYASLIAAANLNDTTYYKEESLEEVRKAGYKEFHPIGLVYQCGYIVDGEETETSRPYQVPAGETTRLYFKRDILTRAKYGMHDFEFVRYYGGENATFDLVDEGTYDYTPKGTLLNKFYVVYRDVVNKEETTCIVKIQPTVQFGETFSYYNIDFKSGNLTHGFNSIQDKEYEDKYLTTGIKINNNLNYSTLPWLCINKGKIVPRQSGTYVFYMKHDEEAAFYISEHELKGNPTDDAPYLILILNEWHTNDNTNYPSEEIRLEEGKEYDYQVVMQNADGDGGGSVGYRIKRFER
ncbi:Immuno-dominant variable surface antigen-like [Histomonas meleagridis]|nr:Immuno-dominant variable surface antigen-like [Histomonas meleagridis]